jgi:hypothetical protein
VTVVNIPHEYYTIGVNDNSNSPEITVSEKLIEFLSSVVGLDLLKYTLTSPISQDTPNSYRYPPEFCGAVKEECRYYKYEADESKIDTMSVFYNKQLVLFKIEVSRGNYIYSETPATDLLNQAKTILQRYKECANNVYSTDNSYLGSMQNILNATDDLAVFLGRQGEKIAGTIESNTIHAIFLIQTCQFSGKYFIKNPSVKFLLQTLF